MRTTSPSKGLSHGPPRAAVGMPGVATDHPPPGHLLMPILATLLFVLALVFALVAWVRCSTDEYGCATGMLPARSS